MCKERYEFLLVKPLQCSLSQVVNRAHMDYKATHMSCLFYHYYVLFGCHSLHTGVKNCRGIFYPEFDIARCI